jgi:hypothetical protein
MSVEISIVLLFRGIGVGEGYRALEVSFHGVFNAVRWHKTSVFIGCIMVSVGSFPLDEGDDP